MAHARTGLWYLASIGTLDGRNTRFPQAMSVQPVAPCYTYTVVSRSTPVHGTVSRAAPAQSTVSY